MSLAAAGLCALTAAGAGVLTGGRLTVEDAYAYSKFARLALATNDIDFRARPHSAEEHDFLASTSRAATWRRRTPTSRPHRPCCSSVSSPRRSRRSSSCDCARRVARRGQTVFAVAPFAHRRAEQAAVAGC